MSASETTHVPRFKKLDNIFGSFDDPMKLSSEIAPWGNGNLVQRYFNGDCGFQLDIRGTSRPDSLNPEFEEYTFVFQKVGLDGVLVGDMSRSSNGEFPVYGRGNGSDHVEPPMPIFPRAIVQDFKSAVQGRIFSANRFSSVVRLYRLKPIPCLLREWICVDGISVEALRGMADREFHSIFVGGRLASLLHYRNLINDGIQSGTELIKELSQFKSHVIFGGDVCDGFDGPLCPVAIHANAGRVGFWINYTLPFSLKGFTVSDGSLDTLPRIHK